MDRAGFKDIVQKNSRKLYVCAFRILNNQGEAEDAVQEVFVKLWNMGPKLDEYRNIDALAVTITKNYCIDQLRKRKHILGMEYPSEIRQNEGNPTPLEILENRETAEIIDSIIQDLPVEFRLIVEMRDMKGLSYEEIAEKTGRNVNSIRVTLSRARKQIRDEFNKIQNEQRKVTNPA